MRSEWVNDENIQHVLAALMDENRLACEVCLETGLRIGDVLAIKSEDILRSERFVIKEEKTGKRRRVYFSQKLREKMISNAGKVFVFEHRTDYTKHRTRQTVFKDLRRAAKAFRVTAHVTPHSLRKMYAVEHFKRTGGNLAKVKELLNHSDEAVTMIYALADCQVVPKKKRRLTSK